MAYSTECVDGGRGIVHTAGGIVTGAEIIDGAARTLATVQAGVPLRYILTDFTDIRRLSVNAEEVRDIARINITTAQINRGICVAIVAPGDHAFGMARMWEGHVDATGWDTRVFRGMDEARAWLSECLGDPGIATGA